MFHHRAAAGLMFLFLIVSAPLAAGGGATSLLSVSSGGVQANGLSALPVISVNERYVAYYSGASTLVAGDTNGFLDVFVRDLQAGTTSRVSVASDGTEGNGDASGAAISGDGRFVAFSSAASNLVAGDGNGARDVFYHDRVTGVTRRLSAAWDGTEANGGSSSVSISADGRYVAFESEATNLVPSDTNGYTDVFVHDAMLATTVRVSALSDGTEANHHASNPVISGDGRAVAFSTYASNLSIADSNGLNDIYLYDFTSGYTHWISLDHNGTIGDGNSFAPAISATGQYVAFVSEATNLAPDDTNGVADVFLKDRMSGDLKRVSVNTFGQEGNAGSFGPSISADGTRILFVTDATNMVADDGNGTSDVFMHDRFSNETTRLSVASGGVESNGLSTHGAIAPYGRSVVFVSYGTNLVPGDSNGEADVFLHDPEATPPPSHRVYLPGIQG